MRTVATKTLQEIDRLAILYNKTKDEKYKLKWYKLIRELNLRKLKND
jgi:hypothetical protein